MDTTEKECIRNAAIWQLAALLFQRPTTKRSKEILDIVSEIEDSPFAKKQIKSLMQLDESEYLALFGPGGKISLREVTYFPKRDPGHILAEITSLYQSFAYLHPPENAPDHLSNSLGFIGYLWLKQAYFKANQEQQALNHCQKARELFITEHLKPSLSGIIEKASTHISDHPYYLVLHIIQNQL